MAAAEEGRTEEFPATEESMKAKVTEATKRTITWLVTAKKLARLIYFIYIYIYIYNVARFYMYITYTYISNHIHI